MGFTLHSYKIIGIAMDLCANLNQNTSESINDTQSPGIKVSKETMDTGDLTIIIDLKNINYSGTTDPTVLSLMQDTDADFTTGATTTEATSISNDKVTFTGIDLQDSQYIGLANKLKYFASISYVSDGAENNAISTTPVIYKIELIDSMGKSVKATNAVEIKLEVDAINSTATVASDFEGSNLTVKFAKGASEAQFELEVLEDNVQEGPETVTLTVSDTQATGYFKYAMKNSATGFIKDDDQVIDLRLQPLTQGNEAGQASTKSHYYN